MQQKQAESFTNMFENDLWSDKSAPKKSTPNKHHGHRDIWWCQHHDFFSKNYGPGHKEGYYEQFQ